MNSIRERIFQALTSRLAPIAQGEGAQILRSPTTAVTREASPALLIFPRSFGLSIRILPPALRQPMAVAYLLARATDTEPAEMMADRLMVACHTALFSDPNLGGTTLGLQELDCDWDIEDADATAAAIPARYQITYRTLVHDLTAQG